MRELVHKLCELGWFYRKISEYLQHYRDNLSFGVVRSRVDGALVCRSDMTMLISNFVGRAKLLSCTECRALGLLPLGRCALGASGPRRGDEATAPAWRE
jgi:hypothetical protein